MRITVKFEDGGPAAEQVRSDGRRPVVDPSVSPAARNLALAHRLAQLIDQGLIADYTATARLLGVSQPRLTHLMGMLLLAPQIQEAILVGTIAPGDKLLRQLARLPEWPDQLEMLARAAAERRARRKPSGHASTTN